MGVSGTTLGISCREDSVDKNKSANNLSTKAITFGVTMSDHIGTTIMQLVVCFPVKSFHHTSTAYGTKALHHHVEHGPRQGQFPR